MISLSYHLHASPQRVWRALVDPSDIERWSSAPAKMSEHEGDVFELWNGDIWGHNRKMQAPIRLVQEWYSGKWEQPSTVTISLTALDNGGTLVELEHTDYPKEEEAELIQGWTDYYFYPLKELVEKWGNSVDN